MMLSPALMASSPLARLGKTLPTLPDAPAPGARPDVVHLRSRVTPDHMGRPSLPT